MLPALVLVIFTRLAMRKLKAVDSEYHKNSKVRVFVSTFLISTFIGYHMTIYIICKNLMMNVDISITKFIHVIFFQLFSEAILMGCFTFMIISISFKENSLSGRDQTASTYSKKRS